MLEEKKSYLSMNVYIIIVCVRVYVCAEGHPTACKLLDGWTITHHCYIPSTACNLDAIQIFTRGCIAAERLTSAFEDKGVKST